MQDSTAMDILNQPAVAAGLSACIHCGLCLTACPTYDIFRTEMDGPRGRIALMQAVAQGAAPLDGTVGHHLDRCLGCRACESACPSGVPYGMLFTAARDARNKGEAKGDPARTFRRFVLRHVLSNRRLLRFASLLIGAAEALGIVSLFLRLPGVPHRLRVMVELAPKGSSAIGVPTRGLRHALFGTKTQSVGAAQSAGAELSNGVQSNTAQADLFLGCVQDAFLPEVNAATARMLTRAGRRVRRPRKQTCCGAAALHAGERELALRLARRNIEAFDRGNPIVVNAGGCAAALAEYKHLLKDEPDWAERAAAFSERIIEATSILAAELSGAPTVPSAASAETIATITSVDSCHLRHGLGVIDSPRDLIDRIPGARRVELADPDRCCGAAGLYAIEQPAIADTVLDAKLADVAEQDPDIIAVTNPGCQLQMLRGVRRAGLRARVAHVVELLDEAYRAGENATLEEKRLSTAETPTSNARS